MRSLKTSFFFLLFFAGFTANSQFIAEFQPRDERKTYLFFGLSLPLRHHFDRDAEVDDYKFLPDGLNTKFGTGIRYKRWLASGLHTGTEWRYSDKLVTIPIYTNLRIAPEINDDTRIVLQPGAGYSFALGRGDLSGYYWKVSLGFEELDGISYYAEYAQYGFSTDDTAKNRAISFGLGLTIF